MFKIELLSKTHHDRKSFSCKKEELNSYLKKTALQHIKKGISKTFVITNDTLSAGDKKRIIGYYTLAVYVNFSEKFPHTIKKKFPDKVPGILLGRLAVSTGYENNKIATRLLMDAYRKTADISENIGIFGLFVDAKDDEVKSFYEKFGFLSFPKYKLEMYLPLSTIKESLSYRFSK